VSTIEGFVAASIVWIAPTMLVLLRLHLGAVVAPKMIDAAEDRAQFRLAELVEAPSAFSLAALGLVSVAAVRAYTLAPMKGPFLSVLVLLYVGLFTYTLFFGFQVRRAGEYSRREMWFALGLSIVGLFVATIATAGF
jgi:hypothetical protein